MTNEEAIKTIELALAEVEWDYPLEYSVAFEEAIRALENQNKLRQAIKHKNKYINSYQHKIQKYHRDIERLKKEIERMKHEH